jgi:hypothetical protein
MKDEMSYRGGMKEVTETGEIVRDPVLGRRIDRIPRRKNSDKPICGSDTKTGGICHNPKGYKTKHVGYGNCFLHGGNKQEIGQPYGQLRWSNLQMETFPAVIDKYKELKARAEKDDYFDLRDHILLMEAITLTILEKAKTMEDLGTAIQYIEKCTKVMQRFDEMEHGRRLVIDYQGVSLILAKVEDAVKRYVPDNYTQDLIARALTGVIAEGFGETVAEAPVIDAEIISD